MVTNVKDEGELRESSESNHKLGCDSYVVVVVFGIRALALIWLMQGYGCKLVLLKNENSLENDILEL